MSGAREACEGCSYLEDEDEILNGYCNLHMTDSADVYHFCYFAATTRKELVNPV